MTGLLSLLRARRLLVVGDLLLDVYVDGTVQRLSPDAPVPVLHSSGVAYRVSGAGIAACSVSELAAEVRVVGVTGADRDGDRLDELLAASGVTTHLVRDPRRPTTVKTRFHTAGHQLLRVDREQTADLATEVEADVRDLVVDEVSRCDAVLVSDYAKGVCTPAVVRAVIEAADRHQVPVVVDPKRPRPDRYAGATLLTPNRSELGAFAATLGCSDLPDRAVAARLRDAGRFGWVLVTRDVDGLSLIGADEVVDVPSHATRVVDVSGAGDVLAAVTGLALAAEQPVAVAAVLGSIAAGISMESRLDKRVDPARLAAALPADLPAAPAIRVPVL